MTSATPMLDKVRQYAKDWGIKIAGDAGGWTSPSSRPWTHDGPGIFSIHWPSRKVVEPIATAPKRARVATDLDAWYLIHEISHILLSIDPEEVIETTSAILALDHYAGRYLKIDGWAHWMKSFTLDVGLAEPWGDTLYGLEWNEIPDEAATFLVGESLNLAVAQGLLTADGAPTFNRSAWMPISMRAEQLAMPLAAALAYVASFEIFDPRPGLPHRFLTSRVRRNRVVRLLEQAVAAEDFERAAVLKRARDASHGPTLVEMLTSLSETP